MKLPFLKTGSGISRARNPGAGLAGKSGAGKVGDRRQVGSPGTESGPENRLGKALKLAALSVPVIAVIGGLGAVVGWLVVNGPETVAGREARRPLLTVAVLEAGARAVPNSSLDTASPGAEDAGVEPGNAAARPGGGARGSDDRGSGDPGGNGAQTAPSASAQTARSARGGNPVNAGADGGGDGGQAGRAAGPHYDAALVERTARGLLPVVSPDGRVAWKAYARPFEAAPGRPRIAIVMTRMGISRSLTAAAINFLPAGISLSFSGAAEDLDAQVAMARQGGHEVFLDMPMEPVGYPANDPGPSTLLTSLSAADNLTRLETVLGGAAGYAGVTGIGGSHFTTDEEALTPVLSALKERGLMYVDSAATSRTIVLELAGALQLPRAIANRRIGDNPAPEDIRRHLAALEQTAQRTGFALGVVPPLPITIDLLASWAETLAERGFALAPATAIAGRQGLL